MKSAMSFISLLGLEPMCTMVQSTAVRAFLAMPSGNSDPPEPEPTISRSSFLMAGSVISPT